jgi:hypothetical protein
MKTVPPGGKPGSDPGRFIRNSILFAAVLLAIVGYINFEVDPFQQYRVPTKYEARFYRSYQRYENPGVAMNYPFDRAIIASSFFENISGSEVDRAFGYGKTQNLCDSALTAYDARKLMETTLATGKVKEVIFNVDYNSFSGNPDHPGFGDKLPLYLYDSTHWNDYPYVLSSVTLRKSLDILMHRTEEGYRTDADAPWYWADGVVFDAANVIGELDVSDMNRRYKQPQRTLDEMMASFEKNIVPVVRDNPKTKFYFVWPPYSILVWIDFKRRDQLDVSLDFKRRFFEEMSKYPNVRIFDFQARTDWIMNLDQYRDMYHFSPVISDALVKEVAAGHDEMTREDYVQRIENLRKIAQGANLESLIADVQARSLGGRRRSRI